MSIMKNLMKTAFLAVLPALLFTACNRDDDPVLTQTASVNVVHASPNAPGVDLLVDNTRVNTSPLVYPNNTGYLEVPAGARNIKVNAAGTSTSVIDANVTLEADRYYSVFAANTLASIEPVVVMDDLTTPAANRAHVRFIHLSPDAPAVDVAVVNGPVLFSNSTFKQATPFSPVAVGTYNLEVRLAGTNTVVLSLPNVQLANGQIYTVFAKGFVNPPAGNQNALSAGLIVNND
ncbi:DUF4397 domain-containing protein [soil metagenome]